MLILSRVADRSSVWLSLIAATVVLWLPLVVYGQDARTVGELLSGGGTKLPSTELRKTVSGATIFGLQRDTRKVGFELTLKDDGTASGYGSTRSITVWGQWKINEQGQLCLDLQNSNRMRFGTCHYYFKLGDRYFSAPSVDATAELLERTIAR